jgi:hypothetical protein
MIKQSILLLLLVLVPLALSEKNGGICFGCTAIVNGIEKALIQQKEPVEQVLFKLCNKLPAPYNDFCKQFIIVE